VPGAEFDDFGGDIMLRKLGLTFGWALIASSVAVGQDVIQETRTTTTPGGATTEIRRVSQLLGANVRLQGDENYGKVEDVILDDNGGIGYLLVSKNNRYVMMPWNAANINYGQRVVAYDVAPRAVQPLYFDRNAWPSISDPQYTSRIQQVFPRSGTVRREVLRPVPGAPQPPGAPVVDQKVKVKRNGDVKVKEKVK
jgi:sporulation protein YlmC with PRC-barrel domain